MLYRSLTSEKQFKIHRMMIINDDGTQEPMPPEQARRRGLERPDILFVREDDWGLACYFKDEEEVYKEWADQWKLRINMHTGEETPLSGDDDHPFVG